MIQRKLAAAIMINAGYQQSTNSVKKVMMCENESQTFSNL
jgi:hypothetical protein